MNIASGAFRRTGGQPTEAGARYRPSYFDPSGIHGEKIVIPYHDRPKL